MSREEKAQTIERLSEVFSKCNIGILTDYRGMLTLEMTALRRKLQETGVEYKVVKNTMARFAAARIGRDDLANSFEGPVAIAFGYKDVLAPAKVLANFIDESGTSLTIKGAFLSDRLLTADEVTTLSKLPSREVLLAQLIGQLKSPISTLVNSIAAPIRSTIAVLQARIQQLEEA